MSSTNFFFRLKVICVYLSAVADALTEGAHENKGRELRILVGNRNTVCILTFIAELHQADQLWFEDVNHGVSPEMDPTVSSSEGRQNDR